MRRCELQRTEHDVLAILRRPEAQALGRDAIRFSTQPSLGGRAIVVEAVGRTDGSADVRIFWAYGHPYSGWDAEGSERVRLPAAAYRRLTASVDASLSSARSIDVDTDNTIVCTDGPEFLTERVRGGEVETLAGFCPIDEHNLHPNEHIAAAMLSLACPYVAGEFPSDNEIQRSCRRWRSLVASDRRRSH